MTWEIGMRIEPTKYYYEFKRYYALAEDQQGKTNFGLMDYKESTEDPLMQHIQLYDVVERKYAGFSQIINDIFYGKSDEHPYYKKIQAGHAPRQRNYIISKWDSQRKKYGLAEWLYIFLLHRVTGSAINYATIPSGYHNTILFDLWQCDTIEEMASMVNYYQKTFYTSIGYQFPKFPKPPEGSKYKRGGDYYLTEFAPRLAREMATLLETSNKKWEFRELGDWMFKWNADNGLAAYRFQYAAFLADIADWYPQYIHLDSMFYYGTNARECISYLATPTVKMSNDVFLDEVMGMINEDMGSYPYNAEDVACDFIRWVENYIRPGAHYEHVDRDTVWSSCEIKDHPMGRQKAMLDLGLVESFNKIPYHPSDTKVLDMNHITILEYKNMVNDLFAKAI
jgi:hypothetical protein